MRRIAHVLTFLALFVFSPACSDEVQQRDAGNGRLDGGHDAVEPRDGSDVPKTDVADASQDTADAKDGGDTDTSGECIPGESWCESVTVRGKCSSVSGEPYTYECNSNQVCRDGQCVEGEACEPEAVLGCADEQSLTVCNARGDDTRTQACPQETPECVEGECVARSCTAGELLCRGGDVHRCNERGVDTELVESCAHQCSSATCTFPDYTNCPSSGCEFYAIDMDNMERSCSSTFQTCTSIESECSNMLSSSNCSFTCVQGLCEPTSGIDFRPMGLHIVNPGDSTLTVQVTNGAGAINSYSVGPHDEKAVILDEQTVHDSSLTSNSFHIATDGPANVFQFNPAYGPQSDVPVMLIGDSSALLPVSAAGTEYLVTSWATHETGWPRDRPYMTIVGTHNGTTVGVTSPTDLLAGEGVSGVAANSTQSFQLDRGEVLQLMGDSQHVNRGDLTGAKIQSTESVVVFTGHECATVPGDVWACDHLEEQLLPVGRWGTEYIAAKFYSEQYQGNQEPDIYRVLASRDNTTLSTTPPISGVNGSRINRGEYVEFETNEDFVLTATSPVQFAQFMVGGAHGARVGLVMGDPSISLPTSSDMHRARHLVSVPYGFPHNYLSIKAPSGTSVFLDGQPVTASSSVIAPTAWEVWRLPVTHGKHEVRADQPIGVDVYGFDRDISYAHPAGWDLR